jgi:hypothetical protein
MVRLHPEMVHKHHSQLSATENRQKMVLQGTIFAMTAIAALITMTVSPPKIPVRTSILTGKLWLAELFTSPVCMYEQLGMAKHVFRKLCVELQLQHSLSYSKYVSAKEKLAIFLYFARTGASSRMLQESFQRSGEYIIT